jgi:hypothetical protein
MIVRTSRLSLRPGEEISIADLGLSSQYVVKIIRNDLPPGKKHSMELSVHVAQIMKIDGGFGWGWVDVDDDSRDILGAILLDNDCSIGVWYSMDLIYGRQHVYPTGFEADSL